MMAEVVGVFAVVVVGGQGWGRSVVMVGFVDAPLSLLFGDADSLASPSVSARSSPATLTTRVASLPEEGAKTPL